MRCLQEVVNLLIGVLVRPESQPEPGPIPPSSPLCPLSPLFSQVGLGPADRRRIRAGILAFVLVWLDCEDAAAAYYWEYATPFIPAWWIKQAQYVLETGRVQDLEPYTVALGMLPHTGDCIRPRPSYLAEVHHIRLTLQV